MSLETILLNLHRSPQLKTLRLCQVNPRRRHRFRNDGCEIKLLLTKQSYIQKYPNESLDRRHKIKKD